MLAGGWIHSLPPVGSIWRGATCGLAWMLICGGGPAAREAQAAPHWPQAMVQDSDLHAVFLVNAHVGWAAGDRGAIWKTIDGGQTWIAQAAPVGDALKGLFFHDATSGWAVATRVLPYTHQSVGTLLRTEDGGATWVQIPHGSLPGLRCITFHDAMHGLAAGDGSPSHPSGAFQTNDGGRTWKPIALRSSTAWTAVDTNRAGRSLLLGLDGSIAVCDHRSGSSAQTPQLPDGIFMRDICWVDEQIGMAAGDHGRVWLSRDGGRRWQDISPRLPAAVSRVFDFHAIASAEGKVCLAGSPGTLVFRSGDYGTTWTVQPGPGRHPVHAMAMWSDQTDCAVGALGTISATAPGGGPWEPRQGNDIHLAAIGISQDGATIPWEFWAHGCSALGMRSRLVSLEGDTLAKRQAPIQDRLQAAAVAVGATGAEVWCNKAVEVERQAAAPVARDVPPASRFPGHLQPGAPAGEGPRLEELLTRALRIWRPSLLVLSSPQASGTAGQALHDAVQASLRGIRSNDYFSDQCQFAKLPPWPQDRELPRVYLVCSEAEATVTILPAELAAALGMSVGELARVSHALLRTRPSGTSGGAHLRPLDASDMHGVAARSPWTASGLREGGPACRSVTPTFVGNWRRFQMQSQQVAALERLLAQPEAKAVPLRAWAAQLENLALALGPDTGPWMLLHCAHSSLHYGLPAPALAALECLTRQFPQHDLQLAALKMAVAWAASREFQHLGGLTAEPPKAEMSATRTVEQAAYEGSHALEPSIEPIATTQDGRQLSLEAQLQIGPTHGMQAIDFQAPWSGVTEDPMRQRVWDTKLWMERATPLVTFSEEVAFLVEADRRQRFRPGQLQRPAYQRLLRTSSSSDWQRCATTELALLDGQRLTGACYYNCRSGPRPHLDGQLGDPIWQDAEPARLSPAPRHPWIHPGAGGSEVPATDFHLACDADFLYLGLTCQMRPHASYPPFDGVRRRDMALDGEDRVEIFLDINRDYNTAWNLVVDHRGCTRDMCHDSVAWNPEWYVAAARLPGHAPAAGHWSIEAAISLTDLAKESSSSDAWVLAVRRTLPDGRQQVWPPGAVLPSRLETAGWLLWPPPSSAAED